MGVLTASALVALGLVVFGPSEAAVADCSGASKLDFACHQERYRALVLNSGVAAAFEGLKGGHEENGFVRAACHYLTHVIGGAAAELYGEVAGAYARGDDFCSSGYYHGVMVAVIADIGADKMLEEADAFCADLRERQKHSFYHSNCAHGLGHGFMGVLENELFESLEACDALTDGWEREPCYAGVFMQNMMAEQDPSHPSKYLEADRPFYPCTDVQARYKTSCYRIQTSYALRTRGNDFARVFELCENVEEDFRAACYQGLGGYASVQGMQQKATDVAQSESTGTLCKLGENYEARSHCILGAAKQFVLHYRGDEQAKALCESLEADLRTSCLEAGEEYYKGFDRLEREENF